MRTDIIEYLQKEVYHRCKQPTNKFGMGCYYHIEAVVKNAEILAEKYGADKETVIIAAWLHDIASITDYAMYEEHHKYGADIAKEILYIAEKSLIEQDLGEEIFLEPIKDFTSNGICPADIILRNWDGIWNKDVRKLVRKLN